MSDEVMDSVESSEEVDTSEEINEGQEEIQEEAPAPKKYKVKVDGNDEEVDEETLLKAYSKSKAADTKFQEASMMRKQAEQFVHLLKTDPIKVLTNPKMGIEFRKLAEEYLVAQLEDESLDPKEKEFREYKRQVEEMNAEKKRQNEEVESKRANDLRDHYQQDYSQKITAALESSGLPKTEKTVKSMAFYMSEGLKRGFELSPTDVAGLVRQDYIEAQKELYASLDGDDLEAMVGKEVAEKLRKNQLKKLKGNQPQSNSYSVPRKSGSSKASDKLSKDEWRAKIRKRLEE